MESPGNQMHLIVLGLQCICEQARERIKHAQLVNIVQVQLMEMSGGVFFFKKKKDRETREVK